MLPVIDDPPPMKTKRTVLDWRLNSQSSFQEGTGNWMHFGLLIKQIREYANNKRESQWDRGW